MAALLKRNYIWKIGGVKRVKTFFFAANLCGMNYMNTWRMLIDYYNIICQPTELMLTESAINHGWQIKAGRLATHQRFVFVFFVKRMFYKD